MRRFILISALVTTLAAPLAAQIALPRVGDVLRPVTGVVGDTLERTTDTARDLAETRLRDLDRLVRRNSDIIERDAAGDPARAGELLALDADAAALERARVAGYAVIGEETLADLGLVVTRLRVPAGSSLAKAQRQLAQLMPEASVSADSLHFQSGVGQARALPLLAAASAPARAAPVGMIDGAPASDIAVAARKGFARGAPFASNHGSAVASLLASAGAGPIRVADVYGTDAAGGNALAIAKALGWLVGEGSKVVTISLIGPQNPLLERAIAAAQRKGVVVVAAVGNAGPAAPPAYPASYPGVVAVTAVDGKRRALIEAGRALHLDYAAPGADIYAADARGKRQKLRGTSFATPLVAARISQALGTGRNWRSALDGEALDLGAKGHDAQYGRGLVCAPCGLRK